MRTVVSGDVRLAVFEEGPADAPTVLLVHGYPDTHTVWDDVAAQLATRFHVVRYDVRGAGASDSPRGTAAYRLPHLKDDLFAVADAVSPDEPVHVVAHDWGSIQSWEAVTEPGAHERIASYTSLSGPSLDHAAYWMRERWRRPTPRKLKQALTQQLHSWYILAFHVPVLPELLWRTVLARRWPLLLSRVEGVPPRPGHPAPTLASDAARGVSLYRANFRSRLNKPRERHTQVPVQVITPTGDHYVTPALTEGLERWAPRLWRRRLHAGHWSALLRDGAQVARMATELIDHVGGEPEARGLARARGAAGPLVVVTGAGSGIGRATAQAFAATGAEVVVCDLDEAAARATGGHAYRVDVSDEAAMREFAAEVADRHGVPDIVVNNAGVGHAGSFLATTTEEWQRVLDVNLWGVIHGCQVFGRLMAEHGEGGHIVNVASAAAYLPVKSLAAYSTSKAAVLMLSDCLRAEVSGRGIGVSTICPGLVATNITRTTTFSGVSAQEQDRKRANATRAYGRRNFGPEKVAAQILRAVATGKATVPVTPEAKAGLALARLSPAALRAAVPHT
ncbi:SDR family oxidoreductase [Amycolatopsis acidiphila]|uniref:SDR family oxidoreductase n=1 Tax=Amycolatopsis acidiphila TaxID=715473 RepID=A0A558A829_9PSEU|nr:SDR family oxidoreductase [Amycolatopsis acidiphila]TVT20419.1 SDR family oxidoreductase [Amycolatopsis acidiphila]UIJ59220.1 SDR family oxidoreductase [Amycolatopsis acidiphila]GHG79211.1 short chain dehydrogenase [Amycolatopsis acidiphila]